jgi:hypothetical protein
MSVAFLIRSCDREDSLLLVERYLSGSIFFFRRTGASEAVELVEGESLII